MSYLVTHRYIRGIQSLQSHTACFLFFNRFSFDQFFGCKILCGLLKVPRSKAHFVRSCVSVFCPLFFCLNDQAYNCLIHFYKRGISMCHHPSCMMHDASYIMHHAPCIMRHASCIMQHASCIMGPSCITKNTTQNTTKQNTKHSKTYNTTP